MTLASKMDQRITFLSPPVGQDEDGYPVTEWLEYLKVWASLKTLKGRSFYAAAGTSLENNRMFQIRYRKNVDDSMRVKWRGVEHDIISLEDDDGQKKSITIYCKVVNAE